MPRPTKRSKSVILVFCEGKSEQVYTDFLKKEFGDVAAIRRPASTGLFDEADNKFKKDKKYREDAEVTDEVWFFFDVETADAGLWDARMKIIKRLRSLRKKPSILKKGKPQPDTALRDTENVPLTEDIEEYFKREVLPFAPDAWIDESKTKVGYEIPFTRYFYKYEAPKPSAEIMAEILELEKELDGSLGEIFQ